MRLLSNVTVLVLGTALASVRPAPTPTSAPAPGETIRAQRRDAHIRTDGNHGKPSARPRRRNVDHPRDARVFDADTPTGAGSWSNFLTELQPHAFWPTPEEASLPDLPSSRLLQSLLDDESACRLRTPGIRLRAHRKDEDASPSLVEAAARDGLLGTIPADPWTALVGLEATRRSALLADGDLGEVARWAQELLARDLPRDVVPYVELYLLNALSTQGEAPAKARAWALELLEASEDPIVLEEAVAALTRLRPRPWTEADARLVRRVAERDDLDIIHLGLYSFALDSALLSGRPDEARTWLELLDQRSGPCKQFYPVWCEQADAAWALLGEL